MMDWNVIRKFSTKEDVFHIHKILGISSLLHFIWRFAMITKYKDAGLWNGGNITTVWIVVHMTLSGTSLIFHIPTNRVAKRPMIYPEFRMHSIVFAWRSLVVMLIMHLMHDNMLSRTLRAFVTMGTFIAADIITDYYARYNSATTMRGMPFSDWVPQWTRDQLNLYYSVSQVLATMNMLFTQRIDSAFTVLFPIQLAAFLMACVRKGLLGADGWHALYAGALGLNYIFAAHVYNNQSHYAVCPSHTIMDIGGPMYWILAIWFCVMRFKYRFNKYVLWAPISLYSIFV